MTRYDYVRKLELGKKFNNYYVRHLRKMHVHHLRKLANSYLYKFQHRSAMVDAFNPTRVNSDYITRYYANKFFQYNKALKDLGES